jgi:uncharacterized NAD(P)/FAD-binding protein YdhS
MSDSDSAPKIITIVGAGFCGALTAVNLLRQNSRGTVRIILVDRGTRPGRGLAYGTWDDNFLLNVPAGNMSALADDPDHFVGFARTLIRLSTQPPLPQDGFMATIWNSRCARRLNETVKPHLRRFTAKQSL